MTARVKNGDELEFPHLLNQNLDDYTPKLAGKGAKTAFHETKSHARRQRVLVDVIIKYNCQFLIPPFSI